MAKSKDEEREPQTISKEEVGSLEAVLGKPEPVPSEPKKETAPPEVAPVAEAPVMTVEAFVRRALAKDSLAIAFVSDEKRTNAVRKLSEQEWRALYDAFLTAPR